jgi:hypothetical protein
VRTSTPVPTPTATVTPTPTEAPIVDDPKILAEIDQQKAPFISQHGETAIPVTINNGEESLTKEVSIDPSTIRVRRSPSQYNYHLITVLDEEGQQYGFDQERGIWIPISNDTEDDNTLIKQVILSSFGVDPEITQLLLSQQAADAIRLKENGHLSLTYHTHDFSFNPQEGTYSDNLQVETIDINPNSFRINTGYSITFEDNGEISYSEQPLTTKPPLYQEADILTVRDKWGHVYFYNPPNHGWHRLEDYIPSRIEWARTVFDVFRRAPMISPDDIHNGTAQIALFLTNPDLVNQEAPVYDATIPINTNLNPTGDKVPLISPSIAGIPYEHTLPLIFYRLPPEDAPKKDRSPYDGYFSLKHNSPTGKE